ncbi:hypothetical protein BUALT_Bualt05G0062100 [Buddleja alternifolia]|uniref:Transposase n=1 Tax=Buddleja alternifolia TaxID=168488 RepID=A0AAV6XH38_9LAMI|nr:hypothetical protein BUALT_Bualt05G0062100 [Buddleja alternifolia]
MDRSWMMLEDRTRPEYENGVQEFLDFAYSSTEPGKKIRCPCKKCNNVYLQNRDDVEADLLEYGIIQNYVTWVLHGEELDESNDEGFDSDEEEDNDQLEFDEVNNNDSQRDQNDYADMQSMLEDCYAASTTNAWREEEAMRNENAVPKWESDKFMRLLADADKKLYLGCENFTKLSFIVTLMHIKILSRWSNKSFSMLLQVLKKALPNGWSTKGYLACPVCNQKTCSFWLKNGKKISYMGHRRFLKRHHKWRSLKSAFDGQKENRDKPVPLTGDDVLEQLSYVRPVSFGKTQPKKRKRDSELNWRKCSIFFRYLYKLKQYVGNKAFPEGSMAEGYIAEECLTFCSMYLNDIETQFNKAERNYERHRDRSRERLSVFSKNSHLVGKGVYDYLDEKSWKQVHSYVLKNCDEVLTFMSEHEEELKQNGCRNVEKNHEEFFAKWLERRIEVASSEETSLVTEDLLHLAYGPDKWVTHYEGCIVNGLRFHTKQREMNKKTQNSGVVVKVEEESGFRDYYGVLTDIIQLDYLGNHHVVLFKCDWFEGKSVQKDKYNYTSINTSKPWNTNEPYVLASQAQQVFYVNDIKLGNDWKIVIEAQEDVIFEVVLDMTTRNQCRRRQTQAGQDIQEQEAEFTDSQIDNNIEGTSATRKRGITTGISVEKKRRKGEKLEVTIHPHRQRIVGHNAKEVKTEICVVLKQHAPLQYAYWNDIPTENKKKMWLAMKQKFNLQEDFKVKDIVYQQMNRQYRSRRHKLHPYYICNKDDEDILHQPPSGVIPEDWELLINYFESDKFKKVSNRNKENRKKLAMNHACWTKSIAQFCYEERDPETEQEPTRTDTWRRTRHSVKKNGWVDEASREAHENLTRLQSQPIEDGQNPMTEDEAFIVVFGEEKSNRLRGCGDGLKPPSKRGQRINKELERENEELKKIEKLWSHSKKKTKIWHHIWSHWNLKSTIKKLK